MDIDSSQISIVIQGAVVSSTKAVVTKLRTLLPKAEIILSTWEGQDTSVCLADKVVLSKDPGAFVQNRKIQGHGHWNNTNRQLVSTLAGLREATKKYTLKTRSDVYIESNLWLKHFGKYDADTPPGILRNRVLICNYYTRNPRVFPLPFHGSDWVFFGDTKDIIDIFNIPLMSGKDTTWFDLHKRGNTLFSDNINRFLPEQWIYSSLLKKHMDLNFQCFYDASAENIHRTERFFSENTVVLDLDEWGIRFEKYNPNRYLEHSTLIHFREWQILYKKYCLQEGGIYWHRYLIKCSLVSLVQGKLRPLATKILGLFRVKEIIRRIIIRSGVR